MSSRKTGRLVILSGPSCVGKTPLCKSLGKFYPELRNQFHKLVLVNSQDPRPGEIDGVDYHFRTRTQIEALRADDRYAVLEARSDLQALDAEELKRCGPSRCGMAIGRLRATIGEGRIAISLSYKEMIVAQSVSSVRCAEVWTHAIAAST